MPMLRFQFLKTSVENIFAPEPTSFTMPFLAFLFCAIFVKFALGFYCKRSANRPNLSRLEPPRRRLWAMRSYRV
nr:hypothetical protein [Campylobacter rectus]